MIQLSGAGKRFGHKLLFENVDWLITPQDRIGLVGANGTGKSTVMKILAGLETLDYGAITIAKGISADFIFIDFIGFPYCIKLIYGREWIGSALVVIIVRVRDAIAKWR